MELRKVESSIQDVLRVRTYKASDNQNTIEEFIHSDMTIAEVIPPAGRWKTLSSAQNSLNSTAKLMHVGVKCITRKGHIYLIKTTA